MKKRFISLTLVVLTAFVLKTPSSAQLPPEEVTIVENIEVIPSHIVIEDLSIDLPVKKALIVDGYWEVFEDSAAWGDQSGYLGQKGNQVISAHAREGMFYNLKNAKNGMVVTVSAGENNFNYKIVSVKKVLPSQIDVVAPTEDETLTLYTCSDFADSKRLIVVAKRV